MMDYLIERAAKLNNHKAKMHINILHVLIENECIFQVFATSLKRQGLCDKRNIHCQLN